MKMGLYDLTAALMGFPATIAILAYQGLKNPLVAMPLWWYAAMPVSSWITARMFRSVIVKRQYFWEHAFAVGMGLVNALIFGTFAFPLLGTIGAMVYLSDYLIVLAPLSVAMYYLLRWVDRYDRYSLARKLEATPQR